MVMKKAKSKTKIMAKKNTIKVWYPIIPIAIFTETSSINPKDKDNVNGKDKDKDCMIIWDFSFIMREVI